MGARAIRAPLDLGDHRREARHIRVAHHAGAELRVHDAPVSKLRATRQPSRAIEQGQPRRRAAPARGAIHLAVREDRHVALGQRILALLLPEDHAVDVAELGLERVHDVLPRLDLALQLAPELDQPRELAPARRAPRPTRRTRRRRRCRRCARRARLPPPRRTRGRSGIAPSERDRPPPAPTHRAGPTARRRRRGSPPRAARPRPSSSAHVTRAIVPCPHAVEYPALWKKTTPRSAPSSSGSTTKQPYMSACPRGSWTSNRRTWSSALERVAALVEDRRAAQRLDAVGHDPEGLAGGVVVGCADLHRSR